MLKSHSRLRHSSSFADDNLDSLVDAGKIYTIEEPE